MGHELTWQSLLECGCAKVYDPLPTEGEEAYCRTHGATTVKLRKIGQYVADCQGCQWKKGFGAARLGSEIEAAKHRRRVRTNRDLHIVILYDMEGKEYRRYGSDQAVLPLPNDDL